jgi:hypothetical protein
MFTGIRPRFDFWLDLRKPEEEDLAYLIVDLKRQRSFAKTVRDGIWLVWDLSQGKTDALLELFPWVAGHFQGEAGGNELTADQVREIVRLEAGEVAADPEISGVTPTLVSGNLKSLAGSNKPLPGPDDHDGLADLLEVKDASSKDGGGAAQNLINSMLAMQSAKSDKPVKPSKSVKKERQSPEDMLAIRATGSV